MRIFSALFLVVIAMTFILEPAFSRKKRKAYKKYQKSVPVKKDPYKRDMMPPDKWPGMDNSNAETAGKEESGTGKDEDGTTGFPVVFDATDNFKSFDERPDLLFPSQSRPGFNWSFNLSAGSDLFLSKNGTKTWYMTLYPELNLQYSRLAMGFGAPLRFSYTGSNRGFHEQDYDSTVDYFKILNYISWGYVEDPFFVRIGKLNSITFGYGNVLKKYTNTLDYDFAKIGTILFVNQPHVSGKLMISHLALPPLVVARVYTHPLSYFPIPAILKKFQVAVNFYSDTGAPTSVVDKNGDGSLLDSDGRFETTDGSVNILSWDLTQPIYENSFFSSNFYFDNVYIFSAGNAVIPGVVNHLHLDAIKFFITLKLEYRNISSNYMNSYFDELYEIHKYSFSEATGLPKYQILRGLSDGDRKNGYFAGLSLGFWKLFEVYGSYEDFDGPNNTAVHLGLYVPVLEFLNFKATYSKRYYDSVGDTFTFDDNSMASATISLSVLPYTVLHATATRLWKINTANEKYEPYDSISFGLSFRVSF